MALSVAIIGRPNVGKSTLFNRLCGLKLAIVDPTPGVTRDRRYGEATLSDLAFSVIDTAGLDEPGNNATEEGMQDQTRRALGEADVAFFLIDARAGITPLDRHFADILRRASCPVVLVANKCEGAAGEAGLYESYELGFGEPVPISAEHGEGMANLYQAIRPFADERESKENLQTSESADWENEADGSGILRLAIIGRPNVGKSTLLNCFLGENRVITGPEAGVTRDSIEADWEWQGRAIKLFDTAGMRRRARVQEKLEKLSVADSLRAIRFAEVVVLVMDAEALGDRQDFVIANHVVEEGRALVIAVNKWDLVEDEAEAMEKLTDRMQTSLPQSRGVPVVTLSALSGSGIDDLMRSVFEMYGVWNARIPTGPLNRWLERMLEEHPPPLVRGRRLRLRYMTQVKARPPSFVIFTTRPGALPDSYRRYLVNGLRERFDLPGVPIRIMLRRGNNPYADSQD